MRDLLESLNPEVSAPAPDLGEVRVYYLESEGITPEEHALFATLLDSEERYRRDRFRDGEARTLFAMAHALTRIALSKWMAGRQGMRVDPTAWRFAADHLGKPRALLPGSTVEPPLFSLSHTRGAALAAVAAGGRLGADMENIDRQIRALPLAKRFFAREECADVASQLNDSSARERFILYWTLKEAYLKALGFGLTKPLASFAFAPAEKAARLLYDRDGIDGEWRFSAFTLPGGRRVALAIGSPTDVKP